MWSREFAKRALRTTVNGAAFALGSTTVSCILAIYIEGAAHRTLFRFFPSRYEALDYVPYGLDATAVEELQRRYRIQRSREATQRESMAASELLLEPFFYDDDDDDHHDKSTATTNANAALTTTESNHDAMFQFSTETVFSTASALPERISETKRSLPAARPGKDQVFREQPTQPFQPPSVSRREILACSMTG